ncbi:hypothetical protein [Parathalassolituus penaei]|uniref:DUF11 domain-containing protein n=1 Tax=Parathalassolituus penaei TaxID=2997323 RepID=A0A9X3IQ34_9GAMM|nr:hypothetical protein [Parathalassolituus penaei]MCY0963742.1 hypothetical protein [Parathalassolituus penaei]
MTCLKQLALIGAGLLASSMSWAVGTAAGTNISNTATASYTLPGGTSTLTKSSTVSLVVLELIDVNVVSGNSSSVSTTAGATNQVLTYTVTNVGNGQEDFVLDVTQLTTDNFDTTNVRVYRDTNGNGVFDSGDTQLTAGSSSIGLLADASATIFVVSDVPGTGTTGDLSQLRLTASSETVDTRGGTPGSSISGAGSGGAPDAVVGNNYTSNATGTLELGTSSANVSINKTIVGTVDPFGGNTLVPGSVVTYNIAVVVTGTVNNLTISDPIPSQMDYVASSLTLDSTALTDSSSDTDAGSFNSSLGTSGTVSVNLGSPSSGSSYTIQLKAEIK